MKVTFEDAELENLVLNHKSKKTRFTMQSQKTASDLKQYSYLHYEQLKHVGMSSVRVINGRVERLLLHELEDGIEISLIEIDETHYGQR